MENLCLLVVFGPMAVLGFLAYQNRKAQEARTRAELEAARQGLTLPAKPSAVGGVVGGVLKAAAEAAISAALPKKPF